MKPATPAAVMPYLRQATYPASREELLRHAIDAAAPEVVRRTIQSLTEPTFEEERALRASLSERANGAYRRSTVALPR